MSFFSSQHNVSAALWKKELVVDPVSSLKKERANRVSNNHSEKLTLQAVTVSFFEELAKPELKCERQTQFLGRVCFS